MTDRIKNICVFCSASNNVPDSYKIAAHELGKLIGENGYNTVYGGSQMGLMFICSDSTKKAGGKVCGIMPEIFANMNLCNPDDCDEFFITKGMRERKALLDEKSDAVIALPGGFGTLEELSEMIVQKQLGYNNKPIVILNIDNFYDNLLRFFDDFIEQSFANKSSKDLYYVAKTPIEAIEYISSYQPAKFVSKFEK